MEAASALYRWTVNTQYMPAVKALNCKAPWSERKVTGRGGVAPSLP